MSSGAQIKFLDILFFIPIGEKMLIHQSYSIGEKMLIFNHCAVILDLIIMKSSCTFFSRILEQSVRRYLILKYKYHNLMMINTIHDGLEHEFMDFICQL